ncbi:MAG: transglutaminase TgpA family protein [Actinomycetota bacterium]
MGSETRARIGLAALLVATLFCFELLFVNGDYAAPALLAMLLAVAIAMVARRLAVPTIITMLVSALLLVWYLALVFEARTTLYGLPTPGAVSGLRASIVDAYRTSVVDFAPVPVRPGYVILVIVGLWIATTIAEVATFRWRRPLVGSMPSIGLVAFSLIVGSADAAGFLILVFLAALLSYWGLESSHRLRSWGRWVPTWTDRPAEEPLSVTGRVARRMGALTLIAALAAPLLLPALEEGVLAWRNQTGTGTGGRVDVLVSLQPEFLTQSGKDLFTVTSEDPAYWRLVSLTRFDGNTWRPGDTARFSLSGEASIDEPGGSPLSQTFDLTALEGEYLPAAAQPLNLDFTDEEPASDVMVDAETFDLQLTEDVQGLTYTVESVVQDASFGELTADRAGTLSNDDYTELGDPLSDEVLDLRDQWIDGARNDLERLIAIQDRLRGFAYDINVEPSASTDYLTEFLTEVRTGYCQQFATAFALLARSLGYPARVSVGFLPGTKESEGTWVVRGTHAHAWPEVYFEDAGWVAFEPTPRGTTTPVPAHTVPPTDVFGGRAFGPPGAPGQTAPGQGQAGDPRQNPLGEGGERLPVEATPSTAPGDGAWRAAFGRLLTAVVILVAAFLLLVPLIKEVRIRRRYMTARTPAGTTRAAFMHFEDEAAELAVARRPSESAVAFAQRVARLEHASTETATRLAHIYEAALFAPRAIDAARAREAKQLAGALRKGMWNKASWEHRAVRLFSARRLAHQAGDAWRSYRRPAPQVATG